MKNEAFNADHPGSKAAIVLWDMGTDCLFIAPTATRSEAETRKAMMDFFGSTDEIRSFYSDNAPELKKAARTLEICHPTSTPACADTNGLAEGKVKLGKSGTRGQLIHSGFHKSWISEICKSGNSKIRKSENSIIYTKNARKFYSTSPPGGDSG